MKRAVIENFLNATDELIKMKKLPKMANFQGEVKMLHYISVIGEVSPSEISEKLGVTTARVAAALNSLEKKEMVVREISEEDRRKIFVKITRKGRKILDEKKEDVYKNFSKLLDLVGDEDAETLVKIITKIVEKMKEKERK